jgi:outer membrane protein assembly factor BamB
MEMSAIANWWDFTKSRRRWGRHATNPSDSQTVISLWHSRLFGDNRPQTGLIRATEDPLIGGVLATAGGLALTGEGDLSAFDAKTGERLWGFSLAHGK